MLQVWPILVLTLLWAFVPAWSALASNSFLGHPYTDLYPSVWGMWEFVQNQPALPNRTDMLGFPEGMGYYYSSPIKGWIASILLPFLGLVHTWNILLIAARIATPLCAWGAARAWGLGQHGSTAAAVVYGCSPFFHGYAVEGIVEGTDGWTLALWAWCIGRKKFKLSCVPFALTILSSWYLGMVVCLLGAIACIWDRRALWSGFGLVLVLPALNQFVQAFPGVESLDPTVRAAMGSQLQIPTPGISQEFYPFAINTYTGFAAVGLALYSRSKWVLLAGIPALLSLGVGPLYSLPVFEFIRFPYRWHAATLMLLAPAVAITTNRLSWGRWVAPIIVIEGLLLSPIEPIIPASPSAAPPYVELIDGPVLDLPGPYAMPPGEINPSRPRARYLLYFQTKHGQPSPWVPDFNGVGIGPQANTDALAPFQRIDPLASQDGGIALPFAELAHVGIHVVVLHLNELGKERGELVSHDLLSAGWTLTMVSKDVKVFHFGQ